MLAALLSVAEAGKPLIAVLPFEGGGKQKYGEFVRNSLHQKLARSYQFEVLEPPDVDRAMAVAGFRIVPGVSPETIGRLARSKLQADQIVWGSARRADTEMGWVFTFHYMDLDRDPAKPQWTLTRKIMRYRELPLLCGDVVVKITGFRPRIGMEPLVVKNKRVLNPRNLLPNGDFEQGVESPAHWQTIDNLTSFWGTEGRNGRCLRVYTDVLQEQTLDWWKAIRNGANFRHPPKRLPTKPPKYNTIGGTHGVHFFSDPIKVKRGMVYRITAYVKGPSKPKIFAKGYAPFTAGRFAAQDREVYRMYLSCETITKGKEWDRHSRTFLPNAYYALLGIEDITGHPLAKKAEGILRARMVARNFPLIPERYKKPRLTKTRFEVDYETTIPELVVYIRDRLFCGHGVYGRFYKTKDGLHIGLKMVSARIKRNVPLVEMTFPVKDEATLAKACDAFLAQIEKRMPFVAYIRIIPFTYWRPDTYRYDDLTLTEEGRCLWEE